MVLLGAGFDAFVEDACNPYCAAKMGAPSLRPCIWWAILKDTMPPGRRDAPSSAAGRREDAPRPTETPFCSSFGRIAPRWPLVIVADIGGAPRGAGRPRRARAHPCRHGWRVLGRWCAASPRPLHAWNRQPSKRKPKASIRLDCQTDRGTLEASPGWGRTLWRAFAHYCLVHPTIRRLLSFVLSDCLFNLGFHSIQIKRGGSLHRREFDGRLG